MESNIKNIKFNNKESNIKNIKFNEEEYEKTKFRFNVPKRNNFIKPEKSILNDNLFNKNK